jgi:hypothetical protein
MVLNLVTFKEQNEIFHLNFNTSLLIIKPIFLKSDSDRKNFIYSKITKDKSLKALNF